MSATPDLPAGQSIRKVAVASFVGSAIEWYDFFLYGTASALVFGKLFFPEDEALTGTLKAYGTFAVGFAARPIGGIVCGHFGDRIGRKSMLVFTLLLMGVATFMVGCLPTYDKIGVWAPILLVVLRLAQGFAVGGEWAGAVLMAVEHAPEGKRGFYGSWPQIGVPVGLLLETGVFALLSQLPEEDFLAWGWRIAFLLSAVLVGVGLYVRLAIQDPPEFSKLKQTRTEARMPMLEAILNHPGNVVLALGARLAENAAFYLYAVFILTYATRPEIGFTRTQILLAVSVAAALEIVTIPFYGWLSDHRGRRPVFIAGAIVTALFAFPFFWLVDSGKLLFMIVALIVALPLTHAAMYGPLASFFSELFDVRVRYSGASLGYQLATIVAGGLSPIIATSLLRSYGSSWPIALYIIGMSLITALSVYLASESAPSRTKRD